MLFRRSYLTLFCLLLFIFICFGVNTFGFIDSDLGWHLQLGHYLLLHGIPKTDPFSYTMPSYPFIDHEWLSNIILFKLYNAIGLTGLSFLFCLLVLITLLLQLLFLKPSKVLFSLLLLQGLSLNSYMGIRPIVVDWLFSEILFILFYFPNLWKKYRYATPLLMLLWVNLHGGFAIGIAFLLLFVTSSALIQKKVNKTDFVVVLISILSTFINPYNLRIWYEVWNQISDSALHNRIVEWLPTFFFLQIIIWTYIVISVIFVTKYFKELNKAQLLFYYVLLAVGISTFRHLPFWLLYALPITNSAISKFIEDVKNIPFAMKRLNTLYKFFLLFIFIVLITQLYPDFLPGSRDFYPVNAVIYLKKHPFSGQLFAPYEWGGYLIWQYPQKKVFIDGRMPSWRWQSRSNKESNDAFSDYEKVLNGTLPLQSIINKYHITHILFYKDIAEQNPPNSYLDSFFNFLPSWLTNNPINKNVLSNELIKANFHLVYKDNIAVIYQKL